ncbi:hypothetical protein KMZ29_25180 [Bradyrhizobium sediminis]|uniref:Uncharacterized protein n=1 Tax=Bradyrhizobium sediminis TaxID=2840469 RepID=A0A975NE97_9BRAD|nr:hypothetical protein [Bradyrhizobium sediminis]QWG12936.1 hypothetical protein KMZ29_25180 [Bradyrhizobium sediminis]
MRFLALFGFFGWRSRNGGPSAAADQDGAGAWGESGFGAARFKTPQLPAGMSVFRVVIPCVIPWEYLGVRALAQNGFLLIADIAGYTMFQRASKIARERLVAADAAAAREQRAGRHFRHSGARVSANPESRDSPMCNCTSEVCASGIPE